MCRTLKPMPRKYWPRYTVRYTGFWSTLNQSLDKIMFMLVEVGVTMNVLDSTGEQNNRQRRSGRTPALHTDDKLYSERQLKPILILHLGEGPPWSNRRAE